MGNFFKMFFASLLGMFVAIGICTILFFAVLGAMMSFGDQPIEVKRNSVLKITFDVPVVDYNDGGMSATDLMMGEEQPTTLYATLKGIENAAINPDIKGIYMDLSQMSLSATAAEEIRRALEEFKKSGKFVVSYADSYSQLGYYLSSISDKVYLNPYGSAMLVGLSAEVMFYKKTLDKLGVDMQIIRHGKFKSAVEPFITDKMSPENREQILAFTGSIWNFLLEEIGKSRNISVDSLNLMCNNLTLKNAENALENKLVDGLKYKDEVIAELCERMNVKTEKELNVVDFRGFSRLGGKLGKSKETLAVIYASGEIVMGDSKHEVSSGYLSSVIRKARNDENIKAVVFRVDSPGGDAQASEIIARELELTAKEKPVVVSMGSLAASGGYWISTPGSVIIANHTTLTGSIGVFGMIPNIQKGMNDLTGLTVDVAKTNENADLLSIYRPMTATERGFIEGQIETIYSKFIAKVANSRSMTKEAVDSIGQGRVWSGVNAYNNGLIDEFGGLKEAIAIAADRANLSKDFRVIELPIKVDRFEELLNSFMSSKVKSNAASNDLKRTFTKYEYLLNTVTKPGIKARMDYEIELH